MKKLQQTKKITLATLKSFAKRNADLLLCKEAMSFDGMIDCVTNVKDEFKPTEITDDKGFYKTGIQGIYTVGSSRDYFTIYEDEKYYGISVSNCCGKTILAILKEPAKATKREFEDTFHANELNNLIMESAETLLNGMANVITYKRSLKCL